MSPDAQPVKVFCGHTPPSRKMSSHVYHLQSSNQSRSSPNKEEPPCNLIGFTGVSTLRPFLSSSPNQTFPEKIQLTNTKGCDCVAPAGARQWPGSLRCFITYSEVIQAHESEEKWIMRRILLSKHSPPRCACA